tara:strand:+ start:72 stop:365 length:294 start_codon:yes stop_codon:yes gene_type:complete
MYRPLPSFLEIKESSIEGRGVFTNIDIPKELTLGLTHVYDEEFPDNLVRTPLGGFINHSETPNCKLFKLGRFFFIKTLEDVKTGQEITLKYSLTKNL